MDFDLLGSREGEDMIQLLFSFICPYFNFNSALSFSLQRKI